MDQDLFNKPRRGFGRKKAGREISLRIKIDDQTPLPALLTNAGDQPAQKRLSNSALLIDGSDQPTTFRMRHETSVAQNRVSAKTRTHGFFDT